MMSLFSNTFWFKRIAITVSFIIVSLILWNTYSFFKKFKEEERTKMQMYAVAMEEMNTSVQSELNQNLSELTLKVMSNNNNPLILVSEEGEIMSSIHLDSIKSKNNKYLERQLAIMKSQNEPIKVSYLGRTDYIYYKDSDLLNKLTYYPLALLLILGLFSVIIYMVYTSNKIAEQNKLWTGMAKETAHQIGTPLSSLLGWIEILKTENIDQDYVQEMQKDIDRLSIITNRFSKIGSLPELAANDIVAITKQTFTYLQSRSSKQVSFDFNTTKTSILIQLNTELYGWVIENLIKNAIDAMQGKGQIKVAITDTQKQVSIQVNDTGKGMPKSMYKQVFKPGFTTKKRGWGLGLSLSKRIIDDYHNGKIQVLKSELGKGTTFEIVLKK